MTIEDIRGLFQSGTAIYRDPDIGEVEIHINPRARRFVSRWTKGRVRFTVPYGARPADVVAAWSRLKPQLANHSPKVRFAIGQTLEFDGLSVELSQQSAFPDRINVISSLPVSKLQIGTDIDLENTDTIAFIDRGLKLVARRVAAKLLLPRAQMIADRLGCNVKSWSITYGTKTLGYCTPRGEISLSMAVVFLPQSLRDYIVCHELAHLSEMNHSPKFHALCDKYCGGHEQELIRSLKAFQWPILR